MTETKKDQKSKQVLEKNKTIVVPWHLIINRGSGMRLKPKPEMFKPQGLIRYEEDVTLSQYPPGHEKDIAFHVLYDLSYVLNWFQEQIEGLRPTKSQVETICESLKQVKCVDSLNDVYEVFNPDK